MKLSCQYRQTLLKLPLAEAVLMLQLLLLARGLQLVCPAGSKSTCTPLTWRLLL